MSKELKDANIMNYQGIDYIRLDQAIEISNQQKSELKEQLADVKLVKKNSELIDECNLYFKEVKELKEQLASTNEVLEDKRRLTIEIEKAMFGENSASNPSLGDVLKSVKDLVNQLNELSIECGIDKSDKIGKSLQIQDMRCTINRLEEQLSVKENELKIALGNVSKLESMIESALNKTK